MISRLGIIGLFICGTLLGTGSDLSSQISSRPTGGGEVGGNGGPLPSWIKSLAREVLNEMEKNPVPGITVDDFRTAVEDKTTKLEFVTKDNHGKLEERFGVKVTVNPFEGPEGPTVQVISSEDLGQELKVTHILWKFDHFNALYETKEKVPDYRSVSHGFVMAAGRESYGYEVTSLPEFGALLDTLESRALARLGSSQVTKNGPKKVKLAGNPSAITLSELNDRNKDCLAGDLKNHRGIIPYVFHWYLQVMPFLPNRPGQSTRVPNWELKLKNAKAYSDRPTWAATLKTEIFMPGKLRLFGETDMVDVIDYVMQFEITYGGYLELSRAFLSIRSTAKFPYLTYGEIDEVRTPTGVLVDGKTLVNKLSIANENGPNTTGFMNLDEGLIPRVEGAPISIDELPLDSYKECLVGAMSRS